MLLSTQAPTSLGEERVRGSLDVLMATPISTRAIVWGKWLATYRIVLWLAILPGITAVIIAFTVPTEPARFRTPAPAGANLTPVGLVDRIVTPALVVAELLSFGAAITSLGLALATWISRPGRAIAVNVAVFVLISVGWPFFLEAFIWRVLTSWLATKYNLTGMEINWLLQWMIVISPFAGPAMTLMHLADPWMGARWKFDLVALGWCLLAWAFAGAFFWAALRSFDRCLGRMRETSRSEDRGDAARFDATEPEDPQLVPMLAAASPRLAEDADGRQNEDR
jgi:hypothetical protein